MDLSTGKMITRRRVKELPMMDIVIRAVEQMAKREGIKSLKFTTHDGKPFESADWIEEVENAENETKNTHESDEESTSDDESEESDEESTSESESDDDDDNSMSESEASDDDIDELDGDLEPIDRQEINNLLAETTQKDDKSNPDIRQEQPPNNDNDNQVEEADEHPAGVSISDVSDDTSELRRSTRDRQAPTRYDPVKGLAQVEKQKSVKFDTTDLMKDLEHCHNNKTLGQLH